MKRCWFGLGLLVVLLGASLAVSWGMDAVHRPIAGELRRAAICAQAEASERAQAEFRKAQTDWERWAHFRGCFADHTPTEAVDQELAAARWAGALAQWPEFAAACARAAKMVEAIGAAHACNWWNLL